MCVWVFYIGKNHAFFPVVMERLLPQKIIYQSQNSHSRRLGKMASRIYETYKNYIMMYGSHIYKIAADMAMYKICDLPPDKHDTPQWKCVLPCC